jgi:hypothetical protein
MIIKFTSKVAWLELRHFYVFSRHLKLGLFGDGLGDLLLSKILRLGTWFRLSGSCGMLRIIGILSQTSFNGLHRLRSL